MSSLNREDVAKYIVERIERGLPELQKAWRDSSPVRHLAIDDVLPEDVARTVASQFPPIDSMMLRSSIRERKRVGVAVDSYAPIVSEVLFAFQSPSVVRAVARITGLDELAPDPSLYAAGLSAMGEGDFLNPHLDNSHDGDLKSYRAINVLYYVSPGWTLENGGNLELWDKDVRHPTTVLSRFNRLVVMATDDSSWHSVSRVRVPKSRYCVSNYYFTDSPPTGRPYRHVTTFTGRPEEPLKRLALSVMDGFVLNAVGRALPSLTRRSKHRIQPNKA